MDDLVHDYCQSLSALGIQNEPVAHPESRDLAVALNALGRTVADCVPALVMRRS